MKDISDLEVIHENFKKELIKLRREELNRIGKEFLMNDYQRRFNTSLELVISAIAGEDNKNGELLKQQREEKVFKLIYNFQIYFEKLKMVQNYNLFSEDLQSKYFTRKKV